MTISQDELDQTRTNFERMITMLGLVANINAKSENDLIFLHVKTEDPGRLIGRNGQTLNSLQHLLNGILLSKKKKFPKVLIDVEGYQDKRRAPIRTRKEPEDERIRKRVLDAVKEVKRWGEKVTIPSIAHTELQAISNTIKDDGEIEIISGNPNRDGTQNVVIQLKNQ